MSDERSIFGDVVAKARARVQKNAETAAARGWVKAEPKAIDRNCPRCTGTGTLMGREGEWAKARLCACREPCALCNDARYVMREVDGYDVAVPCECSALVSRIAVFNDAQIPAGYADKRLSALGPNDPDGYSDRRLESLKRAKAEVIRYSVSMLSDNEQGLLLIGGLGLGKTHLVCALLSYLTLERGIACRFIDYADLMARLRASFEDGAEEKGSAIIEALVQAPVLAIDDLGKGQGTNWELSILDQIVTRRYNARRIILATTNYLPEMWLARRPGGRDDRKRRDLGETLEERIGERLVSRLKQACSFQLLEGGDYRVEGPRGPH